MAYGQLTPRRYFAKNEKDGIDSTLLTSLTAGETTLMVPHDVDEDGRIDVILQKCETDDKKCRISGLYNNQIFDSFFIKSVYLA
jgi:hypothetical protein